MRTCVIILGVSLFCCFKLAGQAPAMDMAEADELLSRNHFAAVWPYYKRLLASDSLNSQINYKMGLCYLNSRSQKEKAKACFQRAIGLTDDTRSVQPTAIKLLADACYQAGDYEQAIRNYETYKWMMLEQKAGTQVVEVLDQKLQLCRMAKELKELKEFTSALIIFENEKQTDSLNPITNHAKAGVSLKRPFNLEKTFHDQDFYENNLVVAEHAFVKEQKADTSNALMESTVAASIDGQIILIYRNEGGNAALYVSRLNQNEWMLPEKLNKTIHNKAWEESECISANGNALYFSSSRKGGYGGKDIYVSWKLPDGNWGKALNLGPGINSPFDEEAPFIHPCGNILYFSSNRYKVKGGFDNYKSTFSDSSGWTTAVNAGYPSFKHNRNISKGKVDDDVDNYRITFTDIKKTPVTMIKGIVTVKNKKMPGYIEITVSDNETGEITGVYNVNPSTGKYIIILPPGKNNNITYEADGYLFHSENVEKFEESSFYRSHNTIELEPLEEGALLVLNNVFFEEGKRELSHSSNVELGKLFELMMAKPKLAIELAMIAPKDKLNSDKDILEQRISEVKKYLVAKGIDAERIHEKVKKPVKRRKKAGKGAITENDTAKLQVKLLNV